MHRAIRVRPLTVLVCSMRLKSMRYGCHSSRFLLRHCIYAAVASPLRYCWWISADASGGKSYQPDGNLTCHLSAAAGAVSHLSEPCSAAVAEAWGAWLCSVAVAVVGGRGCSHCSVVLWLLPVTGCPALFGGSVYGSSCMVPTWILPATGCSALFVVLAVVLILSAGPVRSLALLVFFDLLLNRNGCKCICI